MYVYIVIESGDTLSLMAANAPHITSGRDHASSHKFVSGIPSGWDDGYRIEWYGRGRMCRCRTRDRFGALICADENDWVQAENINMHYLIIGPSSVQFRNAVFALLFCLIQLSSRARHFYSLIAFNPCTSKFSLETNMADSRANLLRIYCRHSNPHTKNGRKPKPSMDWVLYGWLLPFRKKK